MTDASENISTPPQADPAEVTAAPAKPAKQQVRNGTGASRSGNMTISVVCESLVRHPRYGKYVRRRTKLAVHDPRNEAKVGDKVEIVPCRRMSKSKSWRLIRVVDTAKLTMSERTLE